MDTSGAEALGARPVAKPAAKPAAAQEPLHTSGEVAKADDPVTRWWAITDEASLWECDAQQLRLAKGELTTLMVLVPPVPAAPSAGTADDDAPHTVQMHATWSPWLGVPSSIAHAAHHHGDEVGDDATVAWREGGRAEERWPFPLTPTLGVRLAATVIAFALLPFLCYIQGRCRRTTVSRIAWRGQFHKALALEPSGTAHARNCLLADEDPLPGAYGYASEAVSTADGRRNKAQLPDRAPRLDL